MYTPKISIMIPTYNQENWLGQTIESALAQNYPNLEIIVSDDCSTDGTSEIARSYTSDPRLKYCRNATNLGRVANYRKGLYERVGGEWTINLDGDDYFYGPEVISHLVERLREYHQHREQVVAVMGKTLVGFQNVEVASGDYKREGLWEGKALFWNWENVAFGHGATLYKTSLARQIDFYRFDILSSDSESILRLLLRGRVITTNQLIYVWRAHPENASSSTLSEDNLTNLAFVKGPWDEALKMGYSPGLLCRWKQKMIRHYFNKVLRKILLAREGKELRALFRYIYTCHPFCLSIFLYPVNVLKLLLFPCFPAFTLARNLKWWLTMGKPVPRIEKDTHL